MQVAGGLASIQFAHDYIVNGIPVEYWSVARTLPSVLPTAIGQTTFR